MKMQKGEQGMNTEWQRRISRPGEPAIPILCRRMHRVFWVPRRYRSLLAVALDGKPFTFRAIAARSGYSLKGAWAAFRSLDAMGIGSLSTSLGRNGRTTFKVQGDASVVNVSTTAHAQKENSPSPISSRLPLVETFSPTEGGEAWLAGYRAWKMA